MLVHIQTTQAITTISRDKYTKIPVCLSTYPDQGGLFSASQKWDRFKNNCPAVEKIQIDKDMWKDRHSKFCSGIYVLIIFSTQWPLTRFVKLRVAHAPGMPGTFPPPPLVSDPEMDHGTCVTYVPWCIPGSLTSGFPWSRWRGKRSRHSRRMHNTHFYESGKRPMEWVDPGKWNFTIAQGFDPNVYLICIHAV